MTLLPVVVAPLMALMHAEPLAPEKFSVSEAKKVIESIEKDRKNTQQYLKSDPGSALAAVARHSFGKKSILSVGSAPDNEIKLAVPRVSAHHLKVAATSDTFHVDAVDPGAAFFVGESAGAAAVRQASARGIIRVGPYLLRLSHQGYLAIMIFDPKSPRFKEYHGLRYFPIDLSYCFFLPLIRDFHAETVAIQSSTGAEPRASGGSNF